MRPPVPTAIGLATLALAASGARAQEPAAPFPWPGGAKAAVVLSYDDALDSQLDHAAPDLDVAGLKGTFFLAGHSESLARRLPEWRALALRGHELGNHSVFHPCLRKPARGPEREWVRPEYALEGYTVERMRDEVAAMNTTLLALDGERERTFGYTCYDTTAGGRSFADTLRPLFLAARAGEDRIAADPATLDPLLVPSWGPSDATGAQLIAFAQKAVEAGGLAVYTFHGIGGDYITVSREAHRELLEWLAGHRDLVWTDTFRRVMEHVVAEQARTKQPPRP
jgi:peptidoglycan/xylan/chitin deacetylase (PgdA/CDA1 family)